MAKPPTAPDALPVPRRKRRTWVWVIVTFLVMGALQFGPAIMIIMERDLSVGFDWGGFIGYQLGGMFYPMLAGCLGLLVRRAPGLWFFILSMALFIFATLGSLA